VRMVDQVPRRAGSPSGARAGTREAKWLIRAGFLGSFGVLYAASTGVGGFVRAGFGIRSCIFTERRRPGSFRGVRREGSWVRSCRGRNSFVHFWVGGALGFVLSGFHWGSGVGSFVPNLEVVRTESARGAESAPRGAWVRFAQSIGVVGIGVGRRADRIIDLT